MATNNKKQKFVRAMGLILPGFGDEEAVRFERNAQSGNLGAHCKIRDIQRDKLVRVSVWGDLTEAKRDFLVPGALVVADGAYTRTEKRRKKAGEDPYVHHVSVSAPNGQLWVMPSAEQLFTFNEMFGDEDSPEGDDDGFAISIGDSDEF